MLRVKSDKFDWFWSQSIVFTKPFKTGMSLDLARGSARGPNFSSTWQKGSLGTRNKAFSSPVLLVLNLMSLSLVVALVVALSNLVPRVFVLFCACWLHETCPTAGQRNEDAGLSSTTTTWPKETEALGTRKPELFTAATETRAQSRPVIRWVEVNQSESKRHSEERINCTVSELFYTCKL